MSICLDIFKASKVNTSLAQIQYCGFLLRIHENREIGKTMHVKELKISFWFNLNIQ